MALKLEKKIIETEFERLTLYPLGIFEGSSHDLVELDAKQIYMSHVHHNSDAKLHIIRGRGRIVLDGKSFDYSPGKTYEVPRGTSHGFEVNTQTLMLSIQNPPIMDEEGRVDISYL